MRNLFLFPSHGDKKKNVLRLTLIKMAYQFDAKRTKDWKSHLLTEGYVVVTGILTRPEIDEGLSMFLEQFGS